MRRREMWGLLVGLLALAGGCDGDVTHQPLPGWGKLQLTFMPTRPTAPGLTLSQARLRLEALSVVGDVEPSGRTMLSEVEIDMLAAPHELLFDQVPQGLYSLVRFDFTRVELQGQYKESSSDPKDLQADIRISAGINLRCPAGEEVAPDHMGRFGIAVDGGRWFAGVDLEYAKDSNGQIRIDDQNNVAFGQQIAANVAASFAFAAPPAGSVPH